MEIVDTIENLGSQGWWLIHDVFLDPIPHIHENPFVCAMWESTKCRPFIATEEGQEAGFSFMSYMITLAMMAPVISCSMGTGISILTGEWARSGKATAFFQRERWITAVVLVATSPFMAYSYKMLLEGHWSGYIYHGWAKGTLPGKLFEVLIFNIVADTWFYFVHRLFHTFEWLYKTSHYLHHSAHPVNTYIGNGGDFIELAIQGEMQVFFPPLFVPINIRLFMLNAIFMQAYTLFLHSGERIRMPLHQVVIDPYEHNIHHHYGFKNYNFALYFTWWDVLMGTHKASMPAWEKERVAGSRKKVVERTIATEKPLGPLLLHTVIECFACFRVFSFGIFEESKISKASRVRAMRGQAEGSAGGVQNQAEVAKSK